MEKIEIKDFVGIKDMSIEVKQINILIGPQASGKSIIAKLLFYFKNFISEIINKPEEIKGKREFDKHLKRRFEEYFPSYSWGNKQFTIRYSINEEFIEICRKSTTTKNSSEIDLSYSGLYRNQFIKLKNIIQKESEKLKEQEFDFSTRYGLIYEAIRYFLREIKNESGGIATFSQLYIPAGRSFFAHLKDSIFTFLSENNAVDPFLVAFGTYYERMKAPFRLNLSLKVSGKKTILDEISPLTQKILYGKYIREEGEDYLELDDGRKIGVAHSSSGQQETLPLVIILRTIALANHNLRGNTIYIEEPEAHIFPSAQRDVVELISTVYNAGRENLQFFITTHSPYILTAFNNLLQAGILAQNATEEKIQQISKYVPKSRFLKPEEIAVYSLSDGYARSILNIETHLIDTNIIDEVSEELAVQFDHLLDMEL